MITILIFGFLFCSSSIFSQTFNCENIQENDSILSNWKFVREELLNIHGNNTENNKVEKNPGIKFEGIAGFFSTYDDNWFRHNNKKCILSGKLDSLFLFDTKGFYLDNIIANGLGLSEKNEIERDWNLQIRPREIFKNKLINFAKPEKMEKWDKRGKEYLIECEITPNYNILESNDYFEFQNPEYNVFSPASVSQGIFKKNIKDKRFCVYGANVYEKAHNYHPEIHPAEMIWFQNETYNADIENSTIIILQDGSNRFYNEDDYSGKISSNFKSWAKPPIYSELNYAFEIKPGKFLSFEVKIMEEYNCYSINEVNNSIKNTEFLEDGVINLTYDNQNIATINKSFPNADKIGVSFDTSSLILDNGNIKGFIRMRMVVSKPANKEFGYSDDDQPGYAFINVSLTETNINTEEVIENSNNNNSFENQNIQITPLIPNSKDDSLNNYFLLTSSNLIKPEKKKKYYNVENTMTFQTVNTDSTISDDIKKIELIKLKNGEIKIDSLKYYPNTDGSITTEKIPMVLEGNLKIIFKNKDTLNAFIPGMNLSHYSEKDFVTFTEFNPSSFPLDSVGNLLFKLKDSFIGIKQYKLEITPKYYSKIGDSYLSSPQTDSLNFFIDSNFVQSKIKEYFGKEEYPFNIEWQIQAANSITNEIINLNEKGKSKNKITAEKSNTGSFIENSILVFSFPDKYKNIPIKINAKGIMKDSYGLVDTIEFELYNYIVKDSQNDSLIKKIFYSITEQKDINSIEFWELAGKSDTELSINERYNSEYVRANNLKNFITNLIYFDPEKLSDIVFLSNLIIEN